MENQSVIELISLRLSCFGCSETVSVGGLGDEAPHLFGWFYLPQLYCDKRTAKTLLSELSEINY